MQPLIFVVYDGIKNSVFHSQVLAPLLKRLQKNPDQKIIIVSFERARPCKIPSFFASGASNYVQLIYLKRLPFLSKFSLWHSVWKLKQLLRRYNEYELIARGPLAGWICVHSMHKNACKHLTIQARGILAEEYKMAHTSRNLFHHWRARKLFEIEREVYHDYAHGLKLHIEAVSPALCKYLISTYHAPYEQMDIARYDIPDPIPVEDIIAWRYKIRKELGVTDTTHVYCYNGSTKPWQCLEETVNYFKDAYNRYPNSFLLLLTHDTKACKVIVGKARLDETTYQIISTKHEDIYTYLAACDVGLIFRKASPVNWVARPTKALEYQAAGLRIVHNNTVDWLIKHTISLEKQV
ncbi:hypothetical protein JW872_03970 [Candidatus Babeliales bacterium]|nr:hypothetical protein [Candidatus Babeliales bacterium]